MSKVKEAMCDIFNYSVDMDLSAYEHATTTNIDTSPGNFRTPVAEFYINMDVNRALQATGLALDELEAIVGRFAPHSHRAGLLRGKVVVHVDGTVEVRKCFGSRLLWTKERS